MSFDVVQFKAPIEDGRLRTVETGKQEETPFRVGRKPVAFFALWSLLTKVDVHRTIGVLLDRLHGGVDAARFEIAKI